MPNNVPNLNQGLSSYNISLNLTSLFAFPSKLLSKIRWGDPAVVAQEPELLLDLSTLLPETVNDKSSLQQPPLPVAAPIPVWGFFTSGYALALLVMALLMHRIPNIVVPPRQPIPAEHQGAEDRGSSYASRTLRRIRRVILPLDMNRTSTRLALHLPTLYFMTKSLVMWIIIVLQASNMYPFEAPGLLGRLGDWTASKEMTAINWSTFCCICAAFCVEGFVRGLDGAGILFGTQMHANTSPFNLVGYSFLLHIYASPVTHLHRAGDLPTRPDKHALITIAIPLIQLTLFHFLSTVRKWSNHRLVPTAISSLLSLLHFHFTILYHSNIIPNYFRDLSGKGGLPPFTSEVPTSYPLLNYLPNILETILLSVIFLTIILNAVTQLLLLGHVPRPLFGLGLAAADGSTTGSWSWSPPWEEDFGVLLLRVGIASLEATGLRGWANEVGFVPVPGLSHSRTVTQEKIQPGVVQINRSGDVSVTSTYITTLRLIHTTMAASQGDMANLKIINTTSTSRAKTKQLRGWNNEIKDVRVGGGPASSSDRVLVGIPGLLSVNVRTLKIAWHYVVVYWEVVKGLGKLSWAFLRGKQVRVVRPVSQSLEEDKEQLSEDDQDTEKSALAYQKFLSGEAVTDDEGQEHEWDMADDSSSSESDESERGDAEEGALEPTWLYSDLIQGEGVSSSTMLAHMTDNNGSPMTRRRYQSLLGPIPDPDIFGLRNQSQPDPSKVEDGHRNCVVCTVETRQIICWPCRCLSMCDNCRENLASQLSASKHRCPCCRQKVEGYSRIYIP